MIELRPLVHSDLAQVRLLELAPEQHAFVRPVPEILADRRPDDGRHFNIIEADGQIAGLFTIDIRYAEQYAFCEPGELGLLGFLIDRRMQGAGLGKGACQVLGSYLQARYPGYSAVVLTVNCRNEAAYRTYLAGGFADTGELYHGGRSGPQYVMRMSLAS